MTNKKRTVNMFRKNLGTFRLTRADILALESIIKRHMDMRDEILRKQFKISGNGKPSDIDKATFSDTYIEVSKKIFGGRGVTMGRYSFEYRKGVHYEATLDSAADLPVGTKVRYMKISGKPGVYLKFSPFTTELIVRRQDAGSDERRSMDLASRRIQTRLSRCPRNLLNRFII